MATVLYGIKNCEQFFMKEPKKKLKLTLSFTNSICRNYFVQRIILRWCN